MSSFFSTNHLFVMWTTHRPRRKIDHFHLTAEYRGTVRRFCNINAEQNPPTLYLFREFFNWWLSSHFWRILKTSFQTRIWILHHPKDTRNYVCVQVACLRLLISDQFLPSSLSETVACLNKISSQPSYNKTVTDSSTEGIIAYPYKKLQSNIWDKFLFSRMEDYWSTLNQVYHITWEINRTN